MDENLSKLFSRWWDMDVNSCKPGVDYEINLQGYVTSTRNFSKDRAEQALFSFFDEERVFGRPTYKTFQALLNNYESDVTQSEEFSEAEHQEVQEFLDALLETDIIKDMQRYLAAHGKVSDDPAELKQLLFDVWFKIYRRTREDSVINSSGFEHVFVGESRDHSVIGFHNWIQFYLQEKLGNIDYRGYFRRGTTEESEASPRLMTLQFIWKKTDAKPIGSLFIGTSPEFELAMYTTIFLSGKSKVRLRINVYDVEITCYGHGRGIGTAYPYSLSD